MSEYEYTGAVGRFKITLLQEQLNAALAEVCYVEGAADGSMCRIRCQALQAAVDPVVAAHNAMASSVNEAKLALVADARARWLAGPLQGKAPLQIYAYVQAEVDAWASLADAKADLRAWLPLLGVALAYFTNVEE